MDFKPKKQDQVSRTKPTDDILRHYNRKLKASELSTSLRIKPDTHMAMKQIGLLEHKKLYEVMDEALEKYIKEHIPDSTQRLIIDNVKHLQKEMPDK